MRGWHRKKLTLADGEYMLWHVYQHLQGIHSYHIGGYESQMRVRKLLAEIQMEQHKKERNK